MFYSKTIMAELLRCENCPREVIFRYRMEKIDSLREEHKVGATAVMDDEVARMFAGIMHEQGDLDDPEDLTSVRSRVDATFEYYDRVQQSLIDMRYAEEALCLGALRVCSTKGNTRIEVTICNSEKVPKIENIEHAIVERTSIDEF